MRYLILIYSNPASRAVWDSLSDAQRADGWAAYAALTDGLAASGELVVSNALADVSLARRLPAVESLAMASDGPFAEAKEYLAGFFLVECESMERAVEIAATVPEAPYGLVEVRPTMQLSGTDV
jgi:hypothetical protein